MTHPPPLAKGGEGFEGWTNSRNRAAAGGHWQRHSLANRKRASSLLLVCKMPARDKLVSSVTLIWLCLLCRFSSFGHTHFLPQSENGRSVWWLIRDSEPPFLPHTSPFLIPPSLLPPSLLFGYCTCPSPSITGLSPFLLLLPSGRCVCVCVGMCVYVCVRARVC